MKPLRTKAVVLRRTDFGEADRIVQVLTPDGKKAVLARGVRREKSKLAGGIELLSVIDMTLQSGKGELQTLTSARAERFFGNILQSYDRLQFAYYVLKDMARVSEHIDDADFFGLLVETLEALDLIRVSIEIVEICYRLKMAKILGQDANLVRDTDGATLRADANYQFSVADRGFFVQENGPFTAEHIKLLRLATVAHPKIVQQVSGIDAFLGSCLGVARAAHE